MSYSQAPYSQAKVDLSRVPDGLLKDTFIHFAEKHNALVDSTNEIKQDLDQISGTTAEEKKEMHHVLSIIRKVVHYLHGKRFNLTLISLQTYLFLSTLKLFGAKPEHFNRLFEMVIQLLQKAI